MPELRWLMSPYGHHVHAFPEDKIGATFAEALCEHSAPTARLVELSGEQCMACLLILGDQLAGRQAEQFRAALAQQQRTLNEDTGGGAMVGGGEQAAGPARPARADPSRLALRGRGLREASLTGQRRPLVARHDATARSRSRSSAVPLIVLDLDDRCGLVWRGVRSDV